MPDGARVRPSSDTQRDLSITEAGSAFALSSFVPTIRFGLLMFLRLMAGMPANLLYLPALLAGPLDRRIVEAERPTSQDSRSDTR